MIESFSEKPRTGARISVAKSCGWKGPWTQRLTREYFSWSIYSEPQRRLVPGQTTQCLYSLSRKTEICEICQRTGITRALCRRRIGGVVRRADKIRWLENSRSQSPHSEGCESRNNHRYVDRGARLDRYSMDSILSVQNKKLRRKHERSLQKFLEPTRRAKKTFTLPMPWSLAKPVKVCRRIIVRRPLTVQKQLGLLTEHYAEWKKGHLLYCCNQVWMKKGRRIPWNVTAICEIFNISWLMGRHRMKGDGQGMGSRWRRTRVGGTGRRGGTNWRPAVVPSSRCDKNLR